MYGTRIVHVGKRNGTSFPQSPSCMFDAVKGRQLSFEGFIPFPGLFPPVCPCFHPLLFASALKRQLAFFVVHLQQGILYGNVSALSVLCFVQLPVFFIRRRVERHFAPCIFLCIFSFLYYILLYLLITILLLYCYLLTYYQHITSYLITFLRHIFFLWLKCSAIFWPDSCPFHPGFCCGGLTCLFANFAPLVQSLGPDAGWMSLTSGRRRTAWRPWIHF